MPLILLVDDEEDIRWSIKRILREKDYEFAEAASGKEAMDFVRRTIPDLVILDLRMAEMDGLQTMERLLQMESSLPVLILTGVDAVKSAVQAMKLGAVDYLVKPVNHDELRMVVRKTLETSRLKKEVAQLREQSHLPVGFVIGNSAVMRNLDALVRSLARREVSVLIQGESGSGKQMVAETLHQLSPRKEGPFVTLDCGALPETLMESEVFGYEKGAFTGATARKVGKLELAKGGTLFLDEIGNLSLALQAKLLRVLETRQFERLGSASSLRADFRLISATNSNLLELVRKGEFRSDLYYRINVFTLEVPPLRQHLEDLPLLVDHFLSFFNAKHGKDVKSVSRECMKIFETYTWPGNIRQLRNVIERAVLLAHDHIEVQHLPEEISQEQVLVPVVSGTVHLGSLEENALRQALRKHQGDKTKAAAELGISLRTLYYWLKKYNIQKKG